VSDLIVIERLAVETTIGVYEWERTIRQAVYFDIELHTNISTAAETDDLQHALDYKAIADRVIAVAASSSFQLIEALAERIAIMVLSEFPVDRILLKTSKPGAIAEAQNVAVIIERQAQRRSD
jgi:7,8-dihydroneopterin aldolase/epimerase/oxygenase